MNRFSLAALVFFMSLPTTGAAVEKIDWNDDSLVWHSYEEGIAKLAKTNKKGLLVIYADWCPSCKTYSKLFEKVSVTRKLEDLVLIRVNRDNSPSVNEKYNIDGEYVPRTFAVSSNGNVIQKLHPARNEHRFYLSPNYA